MTTELETTGAVVDCLALTLPYDTPLESVCAIFPGEWREGGGGHGYRESRYLVGTSVRLYTNAAREEMGHYLQIMGDGCRMWEESGRTIAELVGQLASHNCRWKRVDIAVDDFERRVSMEEIRTAVLEGHASWRGDSEDYRECKNRKGRGRTQYLGSRESSCMLRMYDKGLMLGLPSFVRFEWEFKHERAPIIAQMILDGKHAEILAHCRTLFDFKDPADTDSNRSRRRSVAWYDAIMGTARFVVKLGQRAAATVERLHNWILKQVAPAFSVLAEISGGDAAFLAHVASVGRLRWRDHHRELLRMTKYLEFSSEGLTFRASPV